MEAKAGTPESASKMASLPFLRPVFLQKTASFYANIGRAALEASLREPMALLVCK
jgi:hypothetical protein